jgi:4-hydroxybenzoyl-CoA thioesterase
MVESNHPPAGMPFSASVQVRFADCDPAGIVFYPRYFEMFNRVVEDWCAIGLELPFREMHMERGMGVPTVHVETDFLVPSRLGDMLRAELAVQKLGRASVTIAIRLFGPHEELRVRATLVLALMDLEKGSAIALPDELRARMALFSPGLGTDPA